MIQNAETEPYRNNGSPINRTICFSGAGCDAVAHIKRFTGGYAIFHVFAK